MYGEARLLQTEGKQAEENRENYFLENQHFLEWKLKKRML